jgi:hypothetical protein
VIDVKPDGLLVEYVTGRTGFLPLHQVDHVSEESHLGLKWGCIGYAANSKAGYRISVEVGYPAGFSDQNLNFFYDMKQIKKPNVTKVSFFTFN